MYTIHCFVKAIFSTSSKVECFNNENHDGLNMYETISVVNVLVVFFYKHVECIDYFMNF